MPRTEARKEETSSVNCKQCKEYIRDCMDASRKPWFDWKVICYILPGLYAVFEIVAYSVVKSDAVNRKLGLARYFADVPIFAITWTCFTELTRLGIGTFLCFIFLFIAYMDSNLLFYFNESLGSSGGYWECLIWYIFALPVHTIMLNALTCCSHKITCLFLGTCLVSIDAICYSIYPSIMTIYTAIHYIQSQKVTGIRVLFIVFAVNLLVWFPKALYELVHMYQGSMRGNHMGEREDWAFIGGCYELISLSIVLCFIHFRPRAFVQELVRFFIPLNLVVINQLILVRSTCLSSHHNSDHNSGSSDCSIFLILGAVTYSYWFLSEIIFSFFPVTIPDPDAIFSFAWFAWRALQVLVGLLTGVLFIDRRDVEVASFVDALYTTNISVVIIVLAGSFVIFRMRGPKDTSRVVGNYDRKDQQLEEDSQCFRESERKVFNGCDEEDRPRESRTILNNKDEGMRDSHKGFRESERDEFNGSIGDEEYQLEESMTNLNNTDKGMRDSQSLKERKGSSTTRTYLFTLSAVVLISLTLNVVHVSEIMKKSGSQNQTEAMDELSTTSGICYLLLALMMFLCSLMLVAIERSLHAYFTESVFFCLFKIYDTSQGEIVTKIQGGKDFFFPFLCRDENGVQIVARISLNNLVKSVKFEDDVVGNKVLEVLKHDFSILVSNNQQLTAYCIAATLFCASERGRETRVPFGPLTGVVMNGKSSDVPCCLNQIQGACLNQSAICDQIQAKLRRVFEISERTSEFLVNSQKKSELLPVVVKLLRSKALLDLREFTNNNIQLYGPEIEQLIEWRLALKDKELSELESCFVNLIQNCKMVETIRKSKNQV
mmetsp:Transcript_4223/g.4898  ORF Transcript_4223/g.4898 Transcript_4223/m.4898 type:complete len:830 (+) Transcript_4223:370-2859(+)